MREGGKLRAGMRWEEDRGEGGREEKGRKGKRGVVGREHFRPRFSLALIF